MGNFRRCSVGALALLGFAASAIASVTVAPPLVTVPLASTSGTITVGISGVSARTAGTASLQFSGVPSGVSTVPAQPSYPFAGGAVNATVAFRFAVSAAAVAGTYAITITDPTVLQISGALSKPSAGSALVTLVVPAPTVSASVTPNPVTLVLSGAGQVVTVLTNAGPGFTGSVTYAFTGLPAFVSSGGAQTSAAPAYPSLAFPFALGNSAAAGTYTGVLVGSDALGTPVVRLPFTVIVTAPPPPIAAAVVPGSIQQGTSGRFTVIGQNFLAGATLAISGGDVSVDSVTVVSAGQIQFAATAADNAPPGARTVVVANPDGQRSGPAPFQVVLRPPPTIAAVVPASLVQGATAQPVIVTGANFLAGASVGIAPAAGIGVGAITVVSPGQIQLSMTIDANAALGPRTVTVTNRDGQSSNAGAFQVLPKPPAVTSVAPPALVLGTLHAVLNVIGDNFRDGVVAVARSTAVTIEKTTWISATMATVQVSVRSDASLIGPALVEMRNPDGGVSVPAGTVLVYPAQALGAPLSVTAIAITFPLPGTFVGTDDRLYPRGVLAIAGTGTVTGTWQLDGVAFDRFTAVGTGGLPVDVRARVPVPISYTGSHTLTLAVDSPATGLKAEVPVIRSEREASALRLYAPRDGAIVDAEPPLFRWSLVPGAFGYEVEVERGLPQLPLTFAMAVAEWRPTAAQLADIGPGLRRWRVRPLYVGGARGEPTEWRRLAVLPGSVRLVLLPPQHRGAEEELRIRWSGGSPGVLYKVEFFRAGGPPVPVFSALTAREEYGLPGSAAGGGPFRVRVTAYGPSGRILGSSDPEAAPISGEAGAAATGRFMLAAAPPQVQRVGPADGATVTTSQPTIAARWSGAVKASDVLLLVDGTDVTPVSTLTADSLVYGCLLPLDPGKHSVRLTLAGQVTSWSFTVALSGQASPPAPESRPGAVGAAPASPAKAAPVLRGDWQLGLQGSVTFVKEDPKTRPDNVLAQISGQADLADGTVSVKAAGDLAVSHDLQTPDRTVQQSRNWLARFGAQEGAYQQQLAVGYAAPTFVEGSELMTTGVARGGAEAIFSTPGPVASIYYSPSNQPVGVSAGSFGPEQKVVAVALSTPASLQSVQVRAIGLKTVDEAGFNSAGGEGKLYGIFGRIGTSPAFGIVFEAARGEFSPNPGSTEQERAGNAFRLGITGTRGTFSYALNVRRTDADFVNPANRGFTVGGIADREGVDLTVTKAWGLTTLSVQLRHIRGGSTSGSVSPTARENDAVVQLNTSLSQSVILQIGGNATTTTGDADTVHQLPKTDNRMWGANTSLSELLGAFSFSQALTYQSVTNGALPNADMTTKGATLAAGGQIVPQFGLFGTAAFTRTEGSAAMGRTDMTLLSLQPSWTITPAKLSFQPLVAFNKSESSLTSMSTKTWQYQIAISWTPPGLGSYASLQFTGGWNRTQTSGLPTPPFQRRLGLVVNLQWGASSTAGGAAAPLPAPMAPPPGFSTGIPSAMNQLPPLGWR